MNRLLLAALTLVAIVILSPLRAEEAAAVEFSGSGFLTVGVGKMLGGTRGNVSDYPCPCFIADYAQGAVYDGRSSLQWQPDSKLGVQGTAFFDHRRLSVTTQLVARGARDGQINLEWLYGSYRLSDSVTVQLGRKRLPMFYFSETQDVGLALPWTHLPPQLYGWEAVNYNGANIMVQQQLGDWSAMFNVLVGNETFKDSGYKKIYNGRQSRSDVRWKDIVGGELNLQKDWLETRLVYLQSKTQARIGSRGTWDSATGSYDPTQADADWSPQPAYRQRIYGLAMNADYHNWLLRGELIRIDHPGQTFRDFASIVALGYRWGKWQPMITHSRYWGESVAGRDGVKPPDSDLEGHATLALTLRYDLTSSSAVKLQYDRQNDRSGATWQPNFGNSRLLTATYDQVF